MDCKDFDEDSHFFKPPFSKGNIFTHGSHPLKQFVEFHSARLLQTFSWSSIPDRKIAFFEFVKRKEIDFPKPYN